jgi:hypothetical protein
MNSIFGEDKRRDTGLKDPLMGLPLIHVGYDWGVMDGDHYYEVEGHSEIRYVRNARSLYYVFNRTRYFRFDDGVWTEYFSVKGSNKLFPVGTPQEEVDEQIRKEKKESDDRRREYEEGVRNGTITPGPEAVRVVASLIDIEDVQVCPLPPPTGALNYIKFGYE